MIDKIVEELETMERTLEAKLLYACESGSRCWNFASKDSDYDVRFIYRKSLDHYLDQFPGSDNVETTVHTDPVIDMQGWDWNKAITLAAKSNPSLIEWLQSPVVYAKMPIIDDLHRLVMDSYSPRALAYHYASLAERQYKAYWNKPGEKVRFKKYLYAVRPLLCVSYMKAHDWELPPMDFHVLREGGGDLSLILREGKELDDLLERKAAGIEREEGRYPALDYYIEEGIKSARHFAETAPKRAMPLEDLQRIFLNGLGGDYHSVRKLVHKPLINQKV